MKLLAFAGSTSSTSINRELVKFVLKSFTGHDVQLLDLNDYEMPLFSTDKEKAGFPKEVHLFLDAIAKSDAIICSMAEHNRNLTAAFKNTFDWCSRITPKVFQSKKMLLLSTSPGGFGGGNAMNIAKNTFPAFGADIIETFSLPKFHENFDLQNGITNPDFLKQLNEKIDSFKLQLK